MAFAVSAGRTVLWDQFEYSGNPEDFSWVLPVAPGAVLEQSSNDWFDSLEAVTATQVSAPQLLCARDDSGCALAGSADDASLSASGIFEGNGVQVLHRDTVGPYDTATLRSTNGDALTQWLTDNGYAIPPDIEPVIAAYVSEGADFIALKLSPGQGVQQMTPVRVITTGAEPILPLRMVAAGTGMFVDIVLYVIGEGRYSMPDLEGMEIDPNTVTWDFDRGQSDYTDMRSYALQQHSGRSYLTTFAQQTPFDRQFESPYGVPMQFAVTDDFSVPPASTLADLYFARSAAPTAATCVPTGSFSDDAVVTEASSAGYGCEGATDIAAALVGMRPSKVWLTRLEMSLPREALDQDCAVEPYRDQEPVSNLIVAGKIENRNCPAPIFTSRIAAGDTPVRLTPWMMALVAVSLLLRRRGARGRAA
jgi:hypothetical protein